MWATLAGLFVEGLSATITAIRTGTAENELKALDILDRVIAEAAPHVLSLRAAIARNKEEAEKALHDKFHPVPDEKTKP